MENDSSPPLSGLQVLAVEQAVSAPFCSRQLADMGADVIKIERPDGGDFARDYDGALNGLSAYFAWLNRGKRSMIIDLKQPPGRAAFSRLIRRADVFIHNLAPGAIEKLGFGYEQLAETHPRLIWCGISGYGPDGPYRDKKAYDMLVQAESGLVRSYRNPRSARQAWSLHRRYRFRPLRLFVHSRRADPARPHRPGRAHRYLDAGVPDGMDDASPLRLAGHR